MRLVIDIHKVRYVQMGVFLRRRQRCVAEELLNDPEVGACLQEMRREGMPEGVGADLTAHADKACIFHDDPPYTPLGKRRAGPVQK